MKHLQLGCTNSLLTLPAKLKERKQMKHSRLWRILLTAVLLVGAVIVEQYVSWPVWQILLVYLIPYLLIGYDVILEAVEGIMDGEPFDENLLMVIATVGALCIGFLPGADTQFPEAVFVMLFFQVGELFEHYAEHRSRRSISSLMDIRPDQAQVEREGELITLHPSMVNIGEIIVVRPGERIPLDGIVVEGNSNLDTVALTGESVPRAVCVDESVASGCVNLTGVLRIRTTCTFEQSTASRIIDLVEHVSENKSQSEAFITRFARAYTPVVVFVAVALAFVPPLFSAHFIDNFSVWLYRALTFLVVSCPCALVISVPLSIFCGIGGASRYGILIKGGNHMDALAKVRTVVFDKTGTLTQGEFAVSAVHPSGISKGELLHLAAHVERLSNHPIAISLRAAYPHESDQCKVDKVEEFPGKGIKAEVNGREVCVGNEAMMQMVGAEGKLCHKVGTLVHVAIDGIYAGHIVISDRIKTDAPSALASLRKCGVRRTVMLTGDRCDVAEAVAAEVGVDEVHAQLLPSGKVEKMESLISCTPAGAKVAFVGDGINDAPVLARADVGIAMGAMGSDAAIEAADVVLMDDKLSKIALSIRIACRTLAIAKQNVVFAISVKILVLLLAAFGLATMGMAVFADVGVTVLAVFNAMRAYAVQRKTA